MAYDVIWHEKVKADLGSLTKQDASRIIAKIKEHLLPDPGAAGKPLKGIFKGLYRYRVGAYPISPCFRLIPFELFDVSAEKRLGAEPGIDIIKQPGDHLFPLGS